MFDIVPAKVTLILGYRALPDMGLVSMEPEHYEAVAAVNARPGLKLD